MQVGFAPNITRVIVTDGRGRSGVVSWLEHSSNAGSKAASNRPRDTPQRSMQGDAQDRFDSTVARRVGNGRIYAHRPGRQGAAALTARSVGRSLALMPARATVVHSAMRAVQVDDAPGGAYLQIIGPRLRSRSFLRVARREAYGASSQGAVPHTSSSSNGSRPAAWRSGATERPTVRERNVSLAVTFQAGRRPAPAVCHTATALVLAGELQPSHDP